MAREKSRKGVFDDSIPDLFSDLCDLFVKETSQKAYLIQPKLPKEKKKRIYKLKAFNTYFTFLKGPLRRRMCLASPDYALTKEERVYAIGFDLRCQRKFDEANQLEGSLTKFKQYCTGELSEDILSLLLTLSDLQSPDDTHNGLSRVPVLYPDKSLPCVLPNGPPVYGDTAIVNHHNQEYMNFPSHLFEKCCTQDDQDISLQDKKLDFQVFEMRPGSHLLGHGVFAHQAVVSKSYEGESRFSLFGALVESKTSDIDILLDIPDIPENCKGLDVRIPKLYESSEDEGFVDTMSTSTTSLCTVHADFDIKGEEDVWDLALKSTRQKHYTWEHIGMTPQPREKAFITESGSQFFDQYYLELIGHLKTLDPSLIVPERVHISMKTLVQNVLNLLIGVPSQSFVYDIERVKFMIREGVCVSGLSPESTEAMCEDLIECGSLYHQLNLFSLPLVEDSFFRAGLIYQAFTGAVRKYLQHYRGCVLSVMEGHATSVLQVKHLLRRLLSQIRYLAQLCQCDRSVHSANSQPETSSRDKPWVNFPNGVRLLSYLYREALDLSSSDHYPMILSLLHTSCGPYVMFVQNWVFHGVCTDLYGEFMVKTQENYLRFRDKSYWTHGYLMIADNVIDSVPLFLLGLANDIFVCGKSINLLRLCNPQHFLFTFENEVPRVMITFCENDLNDIDRQCQGYLSKMSEIARQKQQSRAEMIKRAEKAKQELVQRAREAATKEISRIQDGIIAVKHAQDKKKRILFAELKSQMEKDLRRRASEMEEEEEEDRARVEESGRRDILETRVEEELEARARQEIVDYYEKLSEEATAREQKALWRVRRRQLDVERMAFLQQEEALLAEELAANPTKMAATAALQAIEEVPDKMESEDAEFRQWVGDDKTNNSNGSEAGNLTDAVGAPGELLDGDLPKWAKEGLKNPAPAFGLETLVTEDMPEWARKGLASDSSVIVGAAGDKSGQTSISKSHPSQATMGGILKTQGHDHTKDWSDTKTVDELGYRHVTSEEIPAKLHPSDSKLGDLMYSEPESKKERSERLIREEKLQENTDVSDVHQGEGLGVSEPEEARSLGSNITGEVSGMGPPGPNDMGNKDNGAVKTDMFGASEVEDMVFRKTGVRKDIGPLSKTVSPTKSSVKIVDNVNKEQSPEKEIKSTVKFMGDNQVNKESRGEVRVKSHIKSHSQMSATQESEDTEDSKPHVKFFSEMSATKESKPETERKPHIKVNPDRNVLMESKSQDVRSHLKMSLDQRANTESLPELPKPIRQSIYGHISQLSKMEFDPISAPRLKMVSGFHASQETTYDDKFDRGFQVKAGRKKKVEGFSVNRETDSTDFQPKIRMFENANAWKESEEVDVDANRMERFKEVNVHGHSSQSSVQKILYGSNFGKGKKEFEDTESVGDITKEDFTVFADDWLEPYTVDFGHLDNPPALDLMSKYTQDSYHGFGDYGISAKDDIKAHEFVSLSALLKRSVTAPLLAQISVVNQSVVNYFISELGIEQHFIAIRRFVLMQDGEFGQSISDQLFEKLATNPQPADMLNPMYLNNVLSRASRASLHGDSLLAKNITFALKYLPKTLNQNAAGTFDCLQLTYKVDWPLNIIITDGCMATYSRVFSFTLQLRRVVWVLSDVWYKLKRDAIVHKASTGSQFRRLQLYRHEMQHFVKVIQEYIANQIIHVSWKEFQDDLASNVHSVDDLHQIHGGYLHKCLARSLLNKKASPMMKIIQDIFGLILKFRMQLISSSWEKDEDSGDGGSGGSGDRGSRDRGSGEVRHPTFDHLCATYKSFKEYSKFLFNVVSKLAMRGYQPHLQELVLRLNYNSYYRADLS